MHRCTPSAPARRTHRHTALLPRSALHVLLHKQQHGICAIKIISVAVDCHVTLGRAKAKLDGGDKAKLKMLGV